MEEIARSSSTGWHRWRLFALLVSLALLWLLIRQGGAAMLASPSSDFLQYWAAARLNMLGRNPFVLGDVNALWQEQGWQDTWALVMYNPPWVLTLMAPLALMNVRLAWLVWRTVLWGCAFVSADRLWHYYHGPVKSRSIGWVIGLTFVPTIIAVRSGQLGPVVLLGVVLFLRGIQSNQHNAAGEWLAAVGILLISAKPHVLYLIWLALAMWCVSGQRWSLLGKVGVVTATALFPTMLANPAILVEYAQSVLQRPPDQWVSATWGSHLRMALGWDHFWLQFLPSVLTGVGYVAYAWGRVRSWEWKRELPVLVLFAVATRPYGWTHDLIVAVFALVAAAAQAAMRGKSTLVQIALVYGALETIIVLGNNLVRTGDHQLVWLPLPVVVCYAWMASLGHRQPLV